MVNNVRSDFENTYAANVSNSDLLEGLTADTASGFYSTQGAFYLNNGVFAGYNFSEVAWVESPPGVAEYTLGTGASGLGYDITSINSIAAWNSADFRNQYYDVSVKYLGDAGFTFLAQVDNRLQASTSGSSQSTITENSTGILASGVVALRFDFFDASDGFSGSTTFSEIDVFGIATPAAAAPEPASLLLVSGVLLFVSRRRKKSAV